MESKSLWTITIRCNTTLSHFNVVVLHIRSMFRHSGRGWGHTRSLPGYIVGPSILKYRHRSSHSLCPVCVCVCARTCSKNYITTAQAQTYRANTSIFTRIRSTVIMINVTQISLPSIRTSASEAIQKIIACCSVLTEVEVTVVMVCDTVFPLPSCLTGATVVSQTILQSGYNCQEINQEIINQEYLIF